MHTAHAKHKVICICKKDRKKRKQNNREENDKVKSNLKHLTFPFDLISVFFFRSFVHFISLLFFFFFLNFLCYSIYSFCHFLLLTTAAAWENVLFPLSLERFLMIRNVNNMAWTYFSCLVEETEQKIYVPFLLLINNRNKNKTITYRIFRPMYII